LAHSTEALLANLAPPAAWAARSHPDLVVWPMERLQAHEI
jgi:hypothetical protein